jgi:hypothetical protein
LKPSVGSTVGAHGVRGGLDVASLHAATAHENATGDGTNITIHDAEITGLATGLDPRDGETRERPWSVPARQPPAG